VSDIREGDWVDKVSKPDLDARRVMHVDVDEGWLAIDIGGTWVGPPPLTDYRKVRSGSPTR
jgi:hypothetical protein